MSINAFTATGRIGKDCETRTVGDSAVTTFSLAVDVGYGDKKHTLWVRVNIWGKRGESLAPYLLKGQQVGVSGELDLREWDKDGGGKGTSLEVRANDVALLGGKAESKPAQRQPEPDFDDSSIPF